MKMKLSDIADLVKGSVIGDGSVIVTGVAGLDTASEHDITFAVPPHLDAAMQTKAAAVIIPDTVNEFSKPAIRVENPRVAFTKLLEIFTPQVPIARGVHKMAVVGQDVTLGSNVAIMAFAVIADNAVIGDNTIIYPHTYIGHKTVIGSDTIIYPNVTVRENCIVGDRVIIHSGTVVGSDGFGFVTEKGQHQKVPQVGNVIIEDDVELGANVAIDRATTSSTIVKSGTKVDNLVHLAHNVVIGENCLLVAQTGIAGSVRTGRNVTFAGQSGSAGHITIGDNCTFAARSAPISDVASGSFLAGFPARPHREWIKAEASLYKVPELIKKVRELEKQLAHLKEENT